MEFTKGSFENLRKDIKEALKGVEEKYGLTFETGAINYTMLDFTLKLQATKTDIGVDAKEEKFKMYCRKYGFSDDQYKMQVIHNERSFELIGFNPTKPKNRCNLYCPADGKIYTATADFVKAFGMIK